MSLKYPEKRIGIFGGSFDPPHLGHEALAYAALERLKIAQLWVIPAGLPVHRELTSYVDAATRLKWVESMFAEEPKIRVLDWEVEHGSPVAAVDTLRRFRDERPGIVPVWVCGADSFASMPTWVEYPAHQSLCNVALFSRVGEPEPKLHAGWSLMDEKQWMDGVDPGPGHVIAMDVVLPDISATSVREAAREMKSLNGLVNSRICDDIGREYRLS